MAMLTHWLVPIWSRPKQTCCKNHSSSKRLRDARTGTQEGKLFAMLCTWSTPSLSSIISSDAPTDMPNGLVPRKEPPGQSAL